MVATRLSGVLEDFTYGTSGVKYPEGPGVVGLATPGGARINIANPAIDNVVYQTNNCEVMSILLAKETFPFNPNLKTINYANLKNPQKQVFLTANMVTESRLGGIGPGPGLPRPLGQPLYYQLGRQLRREDAGCILSQEQGFAGQRRQRSRFQRPGKLQPGERQRRFLRLRQQGHGLVRRTGQDGRPERESQRGCQQGQRIKLEALM